MGSRKQYDPKDFPLTFPMFETTQQWVNVLDSMSDVQWIMMRKQIISANVDIMQNMVDVMVVMEEALDVEDE